jgi:hypothetical protein
MAGRAGNRLTCRMPVVDHIETEFKSDNAGPEQYAELRRPLQEGPNERKRQYKGRYARRRVRQSHEFVGCNQRRQPVEESTIGHNRGLRAHTFSLERFLLIGGPIRFPRSLDWAAGSK